MTNEELIDFLAEHKDKVEISVKSNTLYCEIERKLGFDRDKNAFKAVRFKGIPFVWRP